MIYLLYGIDDYLIKLELNKILKENKLDKLNINNYQYDNSLLTDIIEDAITIPFFSDKKILVIDNISFNNIKKKELEILENYFKNTNTSTILVFISNEEKIDLKNNLIKLIPSTNIKQCNKTNINLIIKNMFDDYQISNLTINKLIERVGNNLMMLEQEINKLKIYKINDKIINDEDLEITSKNIDTNIFNFIDDIVNKNTHKILETYNKMMEVNEEPINIIVILANQFRLLYQVKELYHEGKNEKEIATILDVHPYRVKLALQKCFIYSSGTLLNYLESLADLDINIKSGLINPQIGLELFLLNT